jgi:hypothetical protein
VRGFIEHCLPELVMAGVAGDHQVPHAPAAAGGFAGRGADARLPAHPRLTWPQPVAERTVFRLILEQRYGHLNDHALARRYASTITLPGVTRPVASLLGPSSRLLP